MLVMRGNVSWLRMAALCALISSCRSAQAAGIATVAGAFSIAASSTEIVKETHNLFTHPIRTLKRHGSTLKAAATGKPAPKPQPITPKVN